MKLASVSYSQTNIFPNLILDLLEKKSSLSPFVNRWFNQNDIPNQIGEKKKQKLNRDILVKTFKKQYSSLNIESLVKENINKLSLNNTFTVSTGHQLSLFTGPLYYWYKIISVINLSEKLNKKYPKYNFIPLYWMGSEDHDFEEINHFNVFGKTLTWKTESNNKTVGKIKTDSLKIVLEELKQILGESKNAIILIDLFKKAYLEHKTMAEAQRFLVNRLFGEYGVLVLDSNDISLKQLFKKQMIKDILKSDYKFSIDCTSSRLDNIYYKQAYSRPINHFYIDDKGRRNRIEKTGKKFKILNTDLELSQKDIQVEIESYPERFSQNVLLRSLFKETILPNLVTIGGPGELAYWLQMKDVFKEEKIVFPMLKLRDSAILIDNNTVKKLKKLDVSILDLFKPIDELIKKYIVINTYSEINLSEEINHINKIFDSIQGKTMDKTLQINIDAEKKKQLNALKKIEKKMLKSEKLKHQNEIQKIRNIKDKLFPNNILQERYNNFSQYFLMYGIEMIKIIKKNLSSKKGISIIKL